MQCADMCKLHQIHRPKSKIFSAKKPPAQYTCMFLNESPLGADCRFLTKISL